MEMCIYKIINFPVLNEVFNCDYAINLSVWVLKCESPESTATL